MNEYSLPVLIDLALRVFIISLLDPVYYYTQSRPPA